MSNAPVILHIDMNSYFASVEQQANPFLRGKSVGVCAYSSFHSCIIASSIEAKKKGITTGCRARDALFLDPDVRLVVNNSDRYRTTSRKIFSLLVQYSEEIETYSIDEAFLDLTGYARDLDDGHRIGLEIQKRIQREIGEWLRCSVGVAKTRWLAKFAGDTAPKGSVFILRVADLPAYYERFRLTDAWGINTRMERRLQRLGMYTLNELRTFPVENLLRALGKYGYQLWADVNGISHGRLVKPGEPKSIGHSHVLTDREERTLPRRVLMKLCEKTGRRLRERHLQAKGISVWFSFLDGEGFHASHRLHRPAFDTDDIFRPADMLFSRGTRGHDLLALAISVFDLAPRVHQLSFFDDPVARDAVTAAIDTVNDRWGEYTVIRGSMWQTEQHAPDRIGFRKSVSWDPVAS
ncbi:MAG: DNA polymerase IV [bacterium]